MIRSEVINAFTPLVEAYKIHLDPEPNQQFTIDVGGGR